MGQNHNFLHRQINIMYNARILRQLMGPNHNFLHRQINAICNAIFKTADGTESSLPTQTDKHDAYNRWLWREDYIDVDPKPRSLQSIDYIIWFCCHWHALVYSVSDIGSAMDTYTTNLRDRINQGMPMATKPDDIVYELVGSCWDRGMIACKIRYKPSKSDRGCRFCVN